MISAALRSPGMYYPLDLIGALKRPLHIGTEGQSVT